MSMWQFIFESTTPGATLSPVWDFSTALVFGIMVLVGVGLLGFLILRLVRVWHRPELHGLSRIEIVSVWEQIEKTSEQGIMGVKLAVIEADKLLDRVLRSMFMPGETLGERLKSATYKYPRLRHVWNAHRLRNQLVHDTTFEITPRQARQALHAYQAALKVLQAL